MLGEGSLSDVSRPLTTIFLCGCHQAFNSSKKNSFIFLFFFFFKYGKYFIGKAAECSSPSRLPSLSLFGLMSSASVIGPSKV